MSDIVDENAAADLSPDPTDTPSESSSIASPTLDTDNGESEDFFGSGEAAQIEAPSTESEVSSRGSGCSVASLSLSFIVH